MVRPLVHPITKYIGPTYALQEVIYGLVMALGTISAVALGIGLDPTSKDTLILAAIGVNLTWGLADMVMYILTKNFDRLRHQRMADAFRMDADQEWPLETIEDDLSETIVATLDPADQKRIYEDVLESESRAIGPVPRFSAAHFWGGLTCLSLTVLATLPLVIPILLIDPLTLGLRVGSVSAASLLFVVGYLWAPYAGLNKWRAGAVMLSVGSLITVATWILGG